MPPRGVRRAAGAGLIAGCLASCGAPREPASRGGADAGVARVTKAGGAPDGKAATSPAGASARLVGSWRAEGDDGAGRGWYLEYTFAAGGTYRLVGYPPTQEQGRYQATEAGGTLRVRLHDRTMNGEAREDLTLELTPTADGTGLLEGDRTFVRQMR